MYIFFINSKCVLCNVCLSACPTQAINKKLTGKYFVIDSECISCKLCVAACPVNAIEFYKVKSRLKINNYSLKCKINMKKTLYNNFQKINMYEIFNIKHLF